jgi:hypothetical protein
MDSAHPKRLARWRSPEDVLKLKEKPSSPTSVGVVDITVFNELKHAYDDLQSENIELRAIIEIMEAKSLKDKSRRKNRDMDDEDLHADLEHNRHLISRLQQELQNTQHDVKVLTEKLEHKRKLFLGLQESLQASAEECLDLRRNLEKSHLEMCQIRDEKGAEIKVLNERLLSATHRADLAEKKYVQSVADRDDVAIAHKFKFKRYGADLMYVVTAGVYKRVMSRAIGQWRAFTAADVVHLTSAKHMEFVRDKLRGEHVAAVEYQRKDMQRSIDALEQRLERAENSREALLRRCFHSPYSKKVKLFGAWRNACFKQNLEAGVETRAVLKEKQTQLKQATDKAAALEKNVVVIRRECNVAVAAAAVLNVLHRLSEHNSSLRRAYRQWTRVLLIKRAKVTEFVDTYNKLSEALEKEQKIANIECAARNKAERKLEAYREITSSMSSVSAM